MKPFSAILALTLSLLASTSAAPVVERQADLGVLDLLTGVCDKIDGTMLTDTVCRTAVGTDISVAAAQDDGLARVTVSVDGLLSGASITVPVGSLESVLASLGLVSAHLRMNL